MKAGMIFVAFAIMAGAALALSTQLPSGNDVQDAHSNPPAACRDAALIARLTELPEASGLAASRNDPNILWSHNDSSEPLLFALAHDGSLKGRVRVTGATVDDWEAVATASCPMGSCVYIGDIGDNQARRASITIYRMREPAAADSTSAADVLQATYPDGPQDAEALFATAEGALFVVTKGDGGPVNVYRVPQALNPGAPATLQRVTTLAADATGKGSRVTDAAVSPDGRWVALRTADKVLFYETKALTTGRPGTPLQFDARGLNEPQGEGIAWTRNNTIYLAGEGPRGGTLARVSCNLPSP